MKDDKKLNKKHIKIRMAQPLFKIYPCNEGCIQLTKADRAFSKVDVLRYHVLNPFHDTGLFLYPLRILENLWFSDVFRGNRKRPVA